MPSKSKAQARFMAAAAHNPEFAKKAGIKQTVAAEFHRYDEHTNKGMARKVVKRGYNFSKDWKGV